MGVSCKGGWPRLSKQRTCQLEVQILVYRMQLAPAMTRDDKKAEILDKIPRHT